MRKLIIKIFTIVFLIVVIDRMGDYFLKSGLDAKFFFNKKYQILCIGHSHTERGIDEKLLENSLGVQVGKYAMRGVNTFDRQAMIRQAFAHNNSINLVIYDVDINTFNTEGVSLSSYKLLYPFLNDTAIDDYLRTISSSEEYYSRKLLRLLRYPTIMQKYAIEGWFNSNVSVEVAMLDVQQLKDQIAFGKKYVFAIDKANLAAFRETIHFIRAKKARVILLFIPTVDIINSINRNDYNNVVSLFKQEADIDSGVTFINYNDYYERNYELFRDATHLNNKGKTVITKTLVNDVRKIMSEHSSPP